MRELIIHVAKCAQMACLCGVLVLTSSCSDYIISWRINKFFKEISVKEPSSHYDLRDVIPGEWEEVCIAYFPYITRSDIERKFQGKVVGREKFVSDAHYMLLGINGKREITQIVLDVEVGAFLSDNLKGAAWRVNCVPRQEAVLTWMTENGRRYLKLGNP
ncbi:MAG: hypothetical protein AB1473_09035 [Thermodesulfobacteriota bacterium]